MPEKDGPTILKEWWDSLTHDQKFRIYGGDNPSLEDWMGTLAMPDKWTIYYKYKETFDKETAVANAPDVSNIPTAPKVSTPAPVIQAPEPQPTPGLKPVMPTAPPTASKEIKKASEALTKAVNEPKPEKVTPKMEQPTRSGTPVEILDFEGMKMAELRKYAKGKDIKTGGRKMVDIRADLKKAYSS